MRKMWVVAGPTCLRRSWGLGLGAGSWAGLKRAKGRIITDEVRAGGHGKALTWSKMAAMGGFKLRRI